MTGRSGTSTWEGIDWAVRSRVLATGFGVINALLMLITLKVGEMGLFLVGQSLVQIYQISDLGASGFLTTRSGDQGTSGAARGWSVLLGVAGAALHLPFLFLAGLHFLNAQDSHAISVGLWFFIVFAQACSYAVLPVVAMADGLGAHRRAWRRMFAIELVAGASLAAGLLTGSAVTAMVVLALARGLLIPVLVWGLADIPAILADLRCVFHSQPRATLAAWAREALPFQGTFCWLNITHFVPLRLIVPFTYQFQGPRAGAMVGLSMLMGTAALNVAQGFALGAMGRLSVEYALGRIQGFFRLLKRVTQATVASGLLLLGLASVAVELARHAPWAPVAARVPDLAIYAPIFLAHFLLIILNPPAVALRSTGRDTSAPLVGALGLASIPAYRLAATWHAESSVPVAMVILAGLCGLVILAYWLVRKAGIRHPKGGQAPINTN